MVPRKSALSGARRADVAGLWHASPHLEGLSLPRSVESGNLSFNKAVIRGMSIQMRHIARLNVKPSVVVWPRAQSEHLFFWLP